MKPVYRSAAALRDSRTHSEKVLPARRADFFQAAFSDRRTRIWRLTDRVARP